MFFNDCYMISALQLKIISKISYKDKTKDLWILKSLKHKHKSNLVSLSMR